MKRRTMMMKSFEEHQSPPSKLRKRMGAPATYTCSIDHPLYPPSSLHRVIRFTQSFFRWHAIAVFCCLASGSTFGSSLAAATTVNGTENKLFGLDAGETPLNEYPMIMAHDAATTYLEGGTFHPINKWTKTQPDGGLKALLDCGARSFDWRPKVNSDGTLIMHHGVVDVHVPMKDAVEETLSWIKSTNASHENFVHFEIADCEGDDCLLKVTNLFSEYNITVYDDECSDLMDKTISEVLNLTRLSSSGGSLLVTSGCIDAEYNQSIACSGYQLSENDENRRDRSAVNLSFTYTCYADSSSKSKPLNEMWSYVDTVIERGPPASELYSLQTLWQESATSIAIGEAHLSSLLLDESRSTLNRLVYERVESGEMDSSKLNLIEVNNVCDGASDIIRSVRKHRGWGL